MPERKPQHKSLQSNALDLKSIIALGESLGKTAKDSKKLSFSWKFDRRPKPQTFFPTVYIILSLVGFLLCNHSVGFNWKGLLQNASANIWRRDADLWWWFYFKTYASRSSRTNATQHMWYSIRLNVWEIIKINELIET